MRKITSRFVCRLNHFFRFRYCLFKSLFARKKIFIFGKRTWIKRHLNFVFLSLFVSKYVIINVSLNVGIWKVVEFHRVVYLIFRYPLLDRQTWNLHFSHNHIISLLQNADWLHISDEVLRWVSFSPQFTPSVLEWWFDSACHFGVLILHY